MKSRFRHIRHEMPTLNTSSLPDLIFTVLFFFMVVTHMRQTTLKVEYRKPQGTELTRLVKKSAVTYVHIGRAVSPKPSPTPSSQSSPTHSSYLLPPTSYLIQVNDRIVTTDQIADLMRAERNRMTPDDRQQMTVSIRADRSTPMSTINAVKQALRQAGALRISYSADDLK